MQTVKYQKLISYFTKSRIRLHLLFWICVMSANVLSEYYYFEKLGIGWFLVRFFVKFFFLMVLVYVNLYYLIRVFLSQKRNIFLYIVLLLLSNLIISYLQFRIDFAIADLIYKPGYEIRSSNDQVIFFTSRFISNFWYIGSTSALMFARQHFKQRMEVNKIEISKLQTEVKYLIAQINPHFLFNAINTIYVQIDRDNTNARETVTKFSEMLRYQLYECNGDTVSLEKEIQYLQNYVAIQRLRKSQRHQITFSYPDNTANVQIPPMLFTGFLENAFKYVSNDKNRDNFVSIEMLLDENKLCFIVENTKHRIIKADDDKENSGIGLNNIKRRLELQFTDRHKLDIKDTGDTFIINLLLQLA